MSSDSRIPVTVLTGFLGSGKTTLLNRILTEHHGQRIAVIENEFGEVGVDQGLVISADEEVFEMNNGCICCTVRGDLIRILGNLVRRKDRFDRVIVETTGLANPGPVAQTFFVDDDVKGDYRLDGIVTLVDAAHIELHLDDSPEAGEQIGFADVIVLNKTDLVGAEQLARLEARLTTMNGAASLRRAQMADVSIAEVLDIGGFDLARSLERRPRFLEPEYPFEWVGAYQLTGRAGLVVSPGPDPSIDVLLAPIAEPNRAAVDRHAEQMLRRFSEPPILVAPGGTITEGALHRLQLVEPGPWNFTLQVETAGLWALTSQHLASEFALRVVVDGHECPPAIAVELVAAHGHDETVTSVGFELERPLDGTRLNSWLSTLLREQGTDIFRMKGILDIAGEDRRFVFQGVHMLFDGRPGAEWKKDEPRRSQLVFIGKNLDRQALTRELDACVA